MKKLMLSLVVLAASLTANAQRDGRVIKVENFDIYKNPVTIEKNAEDVRVFDFKFKKVVKQRITYWGTCHESDNDKAVDKRTYPCVMTKDMRERVAQVKVRYDVMVPYYRNGDISYRKEMKRAVVNVEIKTLPDYAADMLEDRRIIFPNRDQFRALANELYTLEATATRNATTLKLERN